MDSSMSIQMASPSSFLPSNSTFHCKYHAFLSCTCEDNHKNFVNHLCQQLSLKGICTVKDHKRQEKDSGFFVVVLSENYVSSAGCLDELVKIIDCWETTKQALIVPIFYNVDPCAVKDQTGSVAECFEKHEKNFKEQIEKVQRWRDALTKVATICGWDLRNWEDKILIKQIVRDVSDRLIYTSSNDASDIVGMGSHIAEMEKKLCLDSNVVHMVGIWGMGGIGKTTIAKFIYDMFSTQFEVHCFLANVKDTFKKHGAAASQMQILSKTLMQKRNLNGRTFNAEFNVIKRRLCHKKVLLVLDDVDDLKQLEALAREPKGFGPGSWIIITTRDRHLLDAHGVKDIYEVKYLKTDQALQLFSQHAFKQKNPKIENLELSKTFISYAKGLPLALKVLGSFLNDKSILEWQSVKDKLAIIPDLKIHDVLRVSFDGLEDTHREVFLDIACFFNGKEKQSMRDFFEGCGFFPDLAFAVLQDHALVTISDGRVLMHDLLQEMGQEIVRLESKEEPGKRSRLWIPEDIYHVLTKSTGTGEVEGISFDMFKTKKMHLEPNAFARMNHLRFLDFHVSGFHEDYELNKMHFPHGLQALSNVLRYLYWHGFPMKSLPSNFCAEKLVELRLFNGKVEQLWTQVQPLVNLRRISLVECKYLTRIPDLSEAKNIESIDLQECKSLVELPSSIQYLSNLEYLNLRLCENLRSLPCRIDSKFLMEFNLMGCYKVKKCPEISGSLKRLELSRTTIREVPESIKKMVDLSLLDLDGCSNITKFPLTSGSIEHLSLRETSIEEVPSSIQFFTRLVSLDMSNNKKLSTLPSSICKLKSMQILKLSGCSKFESFPEILEPMEFLTDLYLGQTAVKELPSPIEHLRSLETLLLCGCKKLSILPNSVHKLSALDSIDVSHCENLHSLPELPSSAKVLKANNCESLKTVPSGSKCNFEFLDFTNCFKLDLKAGAHLAIQLMATQFCEGQNHSRILFPGFEIPEWFDDQNLGSLVTLQLPSHGHQFKGIALCIVLALVGSPSLPEVEQPSHCWIYCDCFVKADNSEGQAVIYSWQCFDIEVHLLKSDHVLLWHDPYLEPSQGDWINEESWFNKYAGHEALFEFYFEGIPEYYQHCHIKKCGVRLLYDEAKASRSLDFSSGEEEPNSKRFKISGGQNF